jgi:hypothetical protein
MSYIYKGIKLFIDVQIKKYYNFFLSYLKITLLQEIKIALFKWSNCDIELEISASYNWAFFFAQQVCQLKMNQLMERGSEYEMTLH